MTEFIRVRDKNTGHEYTINAALADDKTTFDSAYERLAEVDAVDLNGTPLPPVYAAPAIDEARAFIDEISAGLGAAEDAAVAAGRDVVRARAELDALDSDIAAQSALVSEHDMRLAKLRGAAAAADSRLDAVRMAVSPDFLTLR